MIGTPGIIKFFFPKDNVETKYTNLYDIPIMTLNKKIFKFDKKKDENIILVHVKNVKENQ